MCAELGLDDAYGENQILLLLDTLAISLVRLIGEEAESADNLALANSARREVAHAFAYLNRWADLVGNPADDSRQLTAFLGRTPVLDTLPPLTGGNEAAVAALTEAYAHVLSRLGEAYERAARAVDAAAAAERGPWRTLSPTVQHAVRDLVAEVTGR